VIEALTEQTRCIEKAVLKKARLRDEFKLLLTVWGIGPILGLTIMYEAGDMSRFHGPGNFASYCRCVEAQRLSNGKKKATNNAKNGNKYLAWAFVEAAYFACALLPGSQAFPRPQSSQGEPGRGHQGHRPQARSRRLPRSAGPAAVRSEEGIPLVSLVGAVSHRLGVAQNHQI
jgi:hypothetical protein